MTLYPGDFVDHRHAAGALAWVTSQIPFSSSAGDEMHLGIDKLGEQRQKVVAWRHSGAMRPASVRKS